MNMTPERHAQKAPQCTRQVNSKIIIRSNETGYKASSESLLVNESL